LKKNITLAMFDDLLGKFILKKWYELKHSVTIAVRRQDPLLILSSLKLLNFFQKND